MESLLPSEIARLVYGYLESEKCFEAAAIFLKSSENLRECYQFSLRNGKFSTRVMGYTLLQCLDTLCAIYRIVQSQISPQEYETVNRYTLPEQLNFLLDSNNSKSCPGLKNENNKVETKVDKTCEQKVISDKYESLPPSNPVFTSFSFSTDDCIETNSTPIIPETTSLDSLPGTKKSRRKTALKCFSDDLIDGSITVVDGPKDSATTNNDIISGITEVEGKLLGKPFLDKTEWQKKIADNINKLRNTPEKQSTACKDKRKTGGKQLNKVIKTVVNQIVEEDPLFDDLLDEIIVSLESVNSSSNHSKSTTEPVPKAVSTEDLPECTTSTKNFPKPETQATSSSSDNLEVAAATCVDKVEPSADYLGFEQESSVQNTSFCSNSGSQVTNAPLQNNADKISKNSNVNNNCEVKPVEMTCGNLELANNQAVPNQVLSTEVKQVASETRSQLTNESSDILVLSAPAEGTTENSTQPLELQPPYFTLLPSSTSDLSTLPTNTMQMNLDNGTILPDCVQNIVVASEKKGGIRSIVYADQDVSSSLVLKRKEQKSGFINIAPKPNFILNSDLKAGLPPIQYAAPKRKYTKKKKQEPLLVEVRLLDSLGNSLKNSNSSYSLRSNSNSAAESYRQLVESMTIDCDDKASESSSHEQDKNLESSNTLTEVVDKLQGPTETSNFVGNIDEKELSCENELAKIPIKPVSGEVNVKSLNETCDVTLVDYPVSITNDNILTTDESNSTKEASVFNCDKTGNEVALIDESFPSVGTTSKESECKELRLVASSTSEADDSKDAGQFFSKLELENKSNCKPGSVSKTGRTVSNNFNLYSNASDADSSAHVFNVSKQTEDKTFSGFPTLEEDQFSNKIDGNKFSRGNLESRVSPARTRGNQRLSLSTPKRKKSHVRALDFNTPPNYKDRFKRKANTSPKMAQKCADEITERIRSVRRSGLFLSPTSPENTSSKQVWHLGTNLEKPCSPEKPPPLEKPCTPEKSGTLEKSSVLEVFSGLNDVKTPQFSRVRSITSPLSCIKETSLESEEILSPEEHFGRQPLPIATRSPAPRLSGGWDKVNGVGLIVGSPSRYSNVTPVKDIFDDESNFSPTSSVKNGKSISKDSLISWDSNLRAMLIGEFEDPKPPEKVSDKFKSFKSGHSSPEAKPRVIKSKMTPKRATSDKSKIIKVAIKKSPMKKKQSPSSFTKMVTRRKNMLAKSPNSKAFESGSKLIAVAKTSPSKGAAKIFNMPQLTPNRPETSKQIELSPKSQVYSKPIRNKSIKSNDSFNSCDADLDSSSDCFINLSRNKKQDEPKILKNVEANPKCRGRGRPSLKKSVKTNKKFTIVSSESNKTSDEICSLNNEKENLDKVLEKQDVNNLVEAPKVRTSSRLRSKREGKKGIEDKRENYKTEDEVKEDIKAKRKIKRKTCKEVKIEDDMKDKLGSESLEKMECEQENGTKNKLVEEIENGLEQRKDYAEKKDCVQDVKADKFKEKEEKEVELMEEDKCGSGEIDVKEDEEADKIGMKQIVELMEEDKCGSGEIDVKEDEEADEIGMKQIENSKKSDQLVNRAKSQKPSVPTKKVKNDKAAFASLTTPLKIDASEELNAIHSQNSPTSPVLKNLEKELGSVEFGENPVNPSIVEKNLSSCSDDHGVIYSGNNPNSPPFENYSVKSENKDCVVNHVTNLIEEEIAEPPSNASFDDKESVGNISKLTEVKSSTEKAENEFESIHEETENTSENVCEELKNTVENVWAENKNSSENCCHENQEKLERISEEKGNGSVCEKSNDHPINASFHEESNETATDKGEKVFDMKNVDDGSKNEDCDDEYIDVVNLSEDNDTSTSLLPVAKEVNSNHLASSLKPTILENYESSLRTDDCEKSTNHASEVNENITKLINILNRTDSNTSSADHGTLLASGCILKDMEECQNQKSSELKSENCGADAQNIVNILEKDRQVLITRPVSPKATENLKDELQNEVPDTTQINISSCEKSDESSVTTPNYAQQQIICFSYDDSEKSWQKPQDYILKENFLKNYTFSVEYESEGGSVSVLTNTVSSEFILLNIPSTVSNENELERKAAEHVKKNSPIKNKKNVGPNEAQQFSKLSPKKSSSALFETSKTWSGWKSPPRITDALKRRETLSDESHVKKNSSIGKNPKIVSDSPVLENFNNTHSQNGESCTLIAEKSGPGILTGTSIVHPVPTSKPGLNSVKIGPQKKNILHNSQNKIDPVHESNPAVIAATSEKPSKVIEKATLRSIKSEKYSGSVERTSDAQKIKLQKLNSERKSEQFEVSLGDVTSETSRVHQNHPVGQSTSKSYSQKIRTPSPIGDHHRDMSRRHSRGDTDRKSRSNDRRDRRSRESYSFDHYSHSNRFSKDSYSMDRFSHERKTSRSRRRGRDRSRSRSRSRAVQSLRNCSSIPHSDHSAEHNFHRHDHRNEFDDSRKSARNYRERHREERRKVKPKFSPERRKNSKPIDGSISSTETHGSGNQSVNENEFLKELLAYEKQRKQESSAKQGAPETISAIETPKNKPPHRISELEDGEVSSDNSADENMPDLSENLTMDEHDAEVKNVLSNKRTMENSPDNSSCSSTFMKKMKTDSPQTIPKPIKVFIHNIKTDDVDKFLSHLHARKS